MMSMVFAAQSLGTFQKDTTINLLQSCDSSTYSNISKIQLPNSTLAIDTETAMVKAGNTYSLAFSDTGQVGKYLVYGHCDENGQDTVWVYDFTITTTGETSSLSSSIVVIALLGMAAIFLVISFFFKGEYWLLKSFFQMMAIGSGLLAINSAKIIANESNSLGTMGNVGITIMIVVMMLFFLMVFIYAFIEVIKNFKDKKALRWDY
jgi:hypothetical protein